MTNKTTASELNQNDLEKVSGGAFPTAVNSQITDSVTQASVKTPGDSPATALGNLCQSLVKITGGDG